MHVTTTSSSHANAGSAALGDERTQQIAATLASTGRRAVRLALLAACRRRQRDHPRRLRHATADPAVSVAIDATRSASTSPNPAGEPAEPPPTNPDRGERRRAFSLRLSDGSRPDIEQAAASESVVGETPGWFARRARPWPVPGAGGRGGWAAVPPGRGPGWAAVPHGRGGTTASPAGCRMTPDPSLEILEHTSAFNLSGPIDLQVRSVGTDTSTPTTASVSEGGHNAARSGLGLRGSHVVEFRQSTLVCTARNRAHGLRHPVLRPAQRARRPRRRIRSIRHDNEDRQLGRGRSERSGQTWTSPPGRRRPARHVDGDLRLRYGRDRPAPR